MLELIPDDWILSEGGNTSGIHQFLESIITHTLHIKHSVDTAKYVSEMDFLNSESKLVEAKRAYLKFTMKKKCCICNNNIADKVNIQKYLVLFGLSQCQCLSSNLRQEGEIDSMPHHWRGLRENLQILISL